jgi:hypothetical protein
MNDTSTLRRQLAEVTAERDALRAQLEGDLPSATAWLQSKVWRQRNQLDVMNRSVLSHRFALRLMNSIREPVTAEEWKKAREALTDERLRERVDEKVPA